MKLRNKILQGLYYVPALEGFYSLRIGEKPGLMLCVTYNPPKRWSFEEAME